MVAFSVNYWHATASRLQQSPQQQTVSPSGTAAKNAPHAQPVSVGASGQSNPAVSVSSPKHTAERSKLVGADKATLLMQASPNLTFQQAQVIMRGNAAAAPNRPIHPGVAGSAGSQNQPAQNRQQSALSYLNTLG
jgi:hypothetical protein